MQHEESATGKECSAEKVQHEKVRHEENMKIETNSKTWKEYNTEKVQQHGKISTWRKCNTKKCNMKKCSTKKTWKEIEIAKHEKSAIRKTCNIERLQHEEGATGEKGYIKIVQHE